MGEGSFRQSSPWLFGPVFDIVVGCGLFALPVALVATHIPDLATSWVVVIGAGLGIVLSHPHLAATLVLGFRLERRTRIAIAVVSVLACVVVVGAHRWPVHLTWIWTAWVTLAPWHTALVTVRITELLLQRGLGDRAASVDRRLWRAAHLAAAVAATATLHVGLDDTLVTRLGVPPSLAWGVAVGAGLCVVLAGVATMARARREGATTSLVCAVGALVIASLTWLILPSLLASGTDLVVYAGLAALLHGAQSLWLLGFVEGRLATIDGRRFDAVASGGVFVALGVGLMTAGPWVVSRGLGYDLVVSALIVQAVVNLHHIVVDAIVWGLPSPRLVLALRGHELAPSRRHEVSNARAVGATLIVGVCVVGGAIDVAQLAGTRPDASERALAWALFFNPNDSRVWIRSAQRALADDDVDQARADLGRAITLSPTNVDAQRALLRLHAVTGHLEEAWARKDAVAPGVLDDPDSLIILADVALQLGRIEDAVPLGERAVADVARILASPAGIEARRVLGMARLERGETGEAIRLLRGAFDDGEKLVSGDALRGGSLLLLGDALARAHVALREWDPASVLWDRVVAGATVVDRPDVAVRALLGQAGISLQRDQAREALDRFQRGLKVAEATTSRAIAEQVARAWLDYGGLLAASDAPLRLRFACGIKARQAAERMYVGPRRRELLRFIDEASRFAEEALPEAEREQVRSDPQAAAQESLTLSYPEPTTEE